MIVPAVTGLALAAWVGIAPTTYYPSKLIWHSAVLLLAPLAAAVVLAVRALRVSANPAAARPRRWRSRGHVALLYVIVQPAAAFAGVWSTADGRMLFRLIETPGAAQAQVVWSGAGEGTDTLTRNFLDVVRPEPGPLRTPQAVLTVARGVRAARRGRGAHRAHGDARGTGSQPLRLLAHREDPGTLPVGRSQEDGGIGRTTYWRFGQPLPQAKRPPSRQCRGRGRHPPTTSRRGAPSHPESACLNAGPRACGASLSHQPLVRYRRAMDPRIGCGRNVHSLLKSTQVGSPRMADPSAHLETRPRAPVRAVKSGCGVRPPGNRRVEGGFESHCFRSSTVPACPGTKS